jgi:hypothetical protein
MLDAIWQLDVLQTGFVTNVYNPVELRIVCVSVKIKGWSYRATTKM